MKYVVRMIFDNEQYPEDGRLVVTDECGREYPAAEFFFMEDVTEFETKESKLV